MQRLDMKTLRYDALSQSVLVDGRKIVLEIAHDALEAFSNRELSKEEAIATVAEEQKRLTRLAEWVPADDGKIHITTHLLMNEGHFEIGEQGHAN